MDVTVQVRRVAGPARRSVRRALIGMKTRDWAPQSRLFVAQEAAEWVLSYEARQLARTARALGVELGPQAWVGGISNQSVFHLSQFTLLLHDVPRRGNRLGVAYFHGRPGTPGMPEFDVCFESMRRRHHEIDRVQVTNHAMQEVILGTGIDPRKLHRIPIGIDTESFPLRVPGARETARRALGLPESAFVIGSFQKDGVGWGEGLEPKLVKGPDVLVQALEALRASVPELHVLLTGVARGYVRRELERLGIPYVHVRPGSRAELAEAYQALDVYLVASRQEGGPKAVLESMATGTPLVATRVGQAQELVRDGVNGWLVDVEDAEALAAGVLAVRDGSGATVRDAGRATAEEHANERLDRLWAALLNGFVERP
jgi:glycosyltransferase involved in cell wall biosynthesis